MRHSTVVVIVVLVAGGLLFQFSPHAPSFDEPKMSDVLMPTDDHGLAVMDKTDSSRTVVPGQGSVTTKFKKQRDAVLRGMKAYKKLAPRTPYASGEVERCGVLIARYLFALDHLPDASKQEYIRSQVKAFILCLNDLNQWCE